MNIDPAVQIAIVAAVQGLLMYWLQNKLGKKVDDNTNLTLAARAEAKADAEKANEFAKQNAKALDGQMSEFKAKLTETAGLEVKIASLVANKAGIEEGAAKEKLAYYLADALAAAKALPSTDEKIVNGKPDKQADRIEVTGDDTNDRVKTVEAHTSKSIEKIEDKLDSKKDK